jgi:hypothetical protein
MTGHDRQWALARMCAAHRAAKDHRVIALRLCQLGRIARGAGLTDAIRRLVSAARKHRSIAVQYGRERNGLIAEVTRAA